MSLFKLLMAAVLLSVVTPALRAATPEDVDKAIAKAVTWLYAHEMNGNWEAAIYSAKAGFCTAFAAYTLICAGENPARIHGLPRRSTIFSSDRPREFRRGGSQRSLVAAGADAADPSSRGEGCRSTS